MFVRLNKKEVNVFDLFFIVRWILLSHSPLCGFHIIPRGAGKGTDAGVRFAKKNGSAQASFGQNLAAFRSGDGAGGGAFNDEWLHAAVFMAYHAALGFGSAF